MAAVHFPNDPEFAAQADYLRLMTDQFQSGKPWPVVIVSGGCWKGDFDATS